MRVDIEDGPFIVTNDSDVLHVLVFVTASAVAAAKLVMLAYCAWAGEWDRLRISSWLATALPVLIVPPIGLPFASALKSLYLAKRELGRLLRIDPLSGALNRRGLAEEVDAALSTGKALSVVMFDIDRFKAINDARGHEAGDSVIVAVAARLNAFCAVNGGLIGRWGGDEFCAIFRGADLETATATAERARAAVAGLAVPVKGGQIAITVSAGVACRTARDSEPEDLMRRADLCLYRAKAAGRDQVVAEAALLAA